MPPAIQSQRPTLSPVTGDLWDSGWFVAGKGPLRYEGPAEQSRFATNSLGWRCSADGDGYYLADESGKVIELTFGRPTGRFGSCHALTARRIEQSQAIVQIRQGARLIRLEMPSEGPVFVRSNQKAISPRPSLGTNST